MKERNFLDRVMEFEQQLESMHKQFRELIGFVAQMTEENHSLQLENHHLRKRLEEIDEQTKSLKKRQHRKKTSKVDVGEGVDNLHVFIMKDFTSAMSITAALEKGKTACSAFHF